MNKLLKITIPYIFLYPTFLYGQPSLLAICDGGSTKGVRTQYTHDKGFEIMNDRATLPSVIYAFDSPQKGKARITIGKNELTGNILRDYPTYKTVSYVFGGVPYLDTVFFESRIVFSTEHKDLFGANVSTTWRLKCKIQR